MLLPVAGEDALHLLWLEEGLGLRWEDVNEADMTLLIRQAVKHPPRNAPEVKETKTGKCCEIAAPADIEDAGTDPEGHCF